VRVPLIALTLILPICTLAQTQSAATKSEVVNYHATIDNVNMSLASRHRLHI